MDSRDTGHRLLAAFLAGELGPAEAKAWDEHLLECEACWRAAREDRAGRLAAQVLRQPAPPGLADRVTFAVEVAAAGRAAVHRPARLPGRSSRRARSSSWLRWPRLAGTAALAVGVLVILAVFLLPGGHQAGRLPAAVAAVARYAQQIRPPAQRQPSHSGWRTAPVEVGRPVTLTTGGQKIVVRTWRLGGTEAVVAVSGHPFPMPARAQGVADQGMAWSARIGKLGLYCRNGQTSELVAAPVPAAELASLAARLPLA